MRNLFIERENMKFDKKTNNTIKKEKSLKELEIGTGTAFNSWNQYWNIPEFNMNINLDAYSAIEVTYKGITYEIDVKKFLQTFGKIKKITYKNK